MNITSAHLQNTEAELFVSKSGNMMSDEAKTSAERFEKKVATVISSKFPKVAWKKILGTGHTWSVTYGAAV